MSFRHTFITQYIYQEDEEDRHEFIALLKNHFDDVNPVYNAYGSLLYIALRASDLDDHTVEVSNLPEFLKAANGILKGDLDIVAAWEAETADNNRQRVFTVKGRGNISRLEYIEKTS